MAGAELVVEAREQLGRSRPSCTEAHARGRIQIGRDVCNDDVVRLWRAVLARIVLAMVHS